MKGNFILHLVKFVVIVLLQNVHHRDVTSKSKGYLHL